MVIQAAFEVVANSVNLIVSSSTTHDLCRQMALDRSRQLV